MFNLKKTALVVLCLFLLCFGIYLGLIYKELAEKNIKINNQLLKNNKNSQFLVNQQEASCSSFTQENLLKNAINNYFENLYDIITTLKENRNTCPYIEPNSSKYKFTSCEIYTVDKKINLKEINKIIGLGLAKEGDIGTYLFIKDYRLATLSQLDKASLKKISIYEILKKNNIIYTINDIRFYSLDSFRIVNDKLIVNYWDDNNYYEDEIWNTFKPKDNNRVSYSLGNCGFIIDQVKW